MSYVSKKPYILYIKKIKYDKDLIDSNKRFEFKKKLSPLSGSELKYDPDKWNLNSSKEYNNCYTYAMGKLNKKLRSKAQPGYASGFSNNDFKCKTFYKGLDSKAITSEE